MKFSKKYINKFCKNIISSPDIIITATIDTNALKNNIQYLKLVSKTDIMSVIKANAYTKQYQQNLKIIFHILSFTYSTKKENIINIDLAEESDTIPHQILTHI
jgi:alanine racemase